MTTVERLKIDAESIIESMLALDDGEALEVMLVLNSFILNWSAYKLVGMGRRKEADRFFETAKELESALIDQANIETMNSLKNNVLEFKPETGGD